MRKKPNITDKEKNFIDSADVNIKDNLKNKSNDFENKSKWPFTSEDYTPVFPNGSNLKKPITLAIKEYEWLAIEEHTKMLGVSKTEWIRFAMYKLMFEEQRKIN